MFTKCFTCQIFHLPKLFLDLTQRLTYKVNISYFFLSPVPTGLLLNGACIVIYEFAIVVVCRVDRSSISSHSALSLSLSRSHTHPLRLSTIVPNVLACVTTIQTNFLTDSAAQEREKESGRAGERQTHAFDMIGNNDDCTRRSIQLRAATNGKGQHDWSHLTLYKHPHPNLPLFTLAHAVNRVY